MPNQTLRRQIVVEAARLVSGIVEDDYSRAIRKAARKVCAGRVPREHLPSPKELHAELQRVGERHAEGLPALPVLIDPIYLSRREADIDEDDFDFEADEERSLDRFSWYAALLQPLAHVKQSRKNHPEGDALYHSLQVYTLAREMRPYDEEFQLAALLHDVGKGIDAGDHIGAALDALDGYVTERTAWLIEHHDEAQRLRNKTLGLRARRRLVHADDFETLELLADCDRLGRVRGMAVPDLEDALEQIRSLSELLDDEEE